MTNSRLKAYFIANPVKNLCKSQALWGEFETYQSPLIYFKRPKWIKDDQCWARLLESIRLEVNETFEVR